jgi:hypothetical protein
MAVTRLDLIELYPEFTNADTNQVNSAISFAQSNTSSTVFGDSHDLAVILYSCHLLAISPYGQEMQLAPDKGEDKYFYEFNRLAQGSGSAYRFPCLEMP